jgi:hypothetical protein
MAVLRKFRLLAAATLVLALAAGVVAAQGAQLETAIKATYLYKFEGYVAWPNGTFSSPSSPISLCVVGDDPFGAVLDQAVSHQPAGERPVTVRRISAASESSGCQIMFLSGSPESVTEALHAVHGAPILTVTDEEDGDSPAGMINFIVKDNRVRFEIDDGAASQSGLAISSDLLKLALSVKPKT